MGLFMQNVMLGLVEHGLGSCPQFSICSYSQTIKEQLKIYDRTIVCGMSVGYPDESAPVNSFIPNRLPLDQYVTWHS
jgi:nitroreductase